MYTLSASQQANFLSTDFMAVETNSTVSSAAVDGAINIVKIKTAGSGGTDGTFTNIPIRGDGSGGAATQVVTFRCCNLGNGNNMQVQVIPLHTIRNAQIVSAGSTNLVRCRVRLYY